MLEASAKGQVLIKAPSLGMELQVPLGQRCSAPPIRALVGQQLYTSMPHAMRESVAMRYGLLTQETSAVLVKIRAEGEKADGLPQIVQVPQMVPQGMVAMCVDDFNSVNAMQAFDRSMSESLPRFARSFSAVRTKRTVACEVRQERTDVPASGADPEREEILRKLEASRQRNLTEQQKLAEVDKRRAGELAERKRLTDEEAERQRAAAADAIEPEIALAVFRQMHACLSRAAFDLPGRFVTGRETVEMLDADLRVTAKRLLEKCKVSLDDEGQCARFALALAAVFGEPILSDEDEALLAIVAMGSGKALTRNLNEVYAAVRALEDLIRNFLP